MIRSARLSKCACLVVMLTALATAWPALAQVEIEAIAGSPFGVGRVTVGLIGEGPLAPASDDRFVVQDRDGRTHYPVLETGQVRRVLRQLLNVETPRRATIYFLFRGDAPLDLTVFAPRAHASKVAVRRGDAAGHRRLLEAWWRQYTRHTADLVKSGEYPAVVENYLTATLARRLSLQVPPYVTRAYPRGELDRTVGLMLGAESIRTAMQADTLLANVSSREAADRALPQAVLPPTIDFPASADTVEVEPIAMHVPQECIYVRFGSFTNYTWLREFLSEWGGDLKNMVAVRGVDYGMNERLEQQLGLHETVLSKILGPAVIADVAILASDTFVREGAAVGILFQARNNLALATSIVGQRLELVNGASDATEQTVMIAGHEVSLISTPDNTVRSFYARDGDFHLVTTSKTIVQRFFEAGQGDRSLGGSEEFRYARGVMPLVRDDTVFVYLSDALFRILASPHYRVEMTRRMLSGGDIELLKVARLAARGEGYDATSVADLVAAGFLPQRFGERPDGSRLVDEGGQLVDSLRGAPGAFLPVADVEIDGITASEESAYRKFSEFYRASWERMDPVMIGIGRSTIGDAEGERITLDVEITPYAKSNYGFLASWLGPATKQRIAPVPGDLISSQLVLARGLNDQQLHHIFAGLRDANVPFDVRGGEVKVQGFGLMSLRGYVGAWPRLGLLDFLLGRESPEPDAEGYSRGAFGSWQRETSPFRVFSLKRDVLEEVTPNLYIEDAERPAQARLRVGDLSRAQLARTINAFGYMRAYQTSVAGSRFINSLSRQLHVPPEDAYLAAEDLIGAELVCALGGEYALGEHAGGLKIWNSTAHVEENRFMLTTVPEDYEFPLLEWFRGLDVELSLTDESLRAWAQLDVDRGARASGPLDFLSLPSAEELLSPETVAPEAVNPEIQMPAAPRPPDDEN